MMNNKLVDALKMPGVEYILQRKPTTINQLEQLLMHEAAKGVGNWRSTGQAVQAFNLVRYGIKRPEKGGSKMNHQNTPTD